MRHPLVIIGNAVFTLLVVVSVAVGAALFFGKQRFDAPGPLAEDKVVNIPRGLGIRDIADLLAARRRDRSALGLHGRRAGAQGARRPQVRRIPVHQAAPALPTSSTPSSKARSCSTSFTVPEGLTSEQIVARLLENDALAGQIKEIPREGTLLPETYKFTRGMTREQIIQRMQQAHRRVLQEVWEHRTPDLPVKTPEQLVTLASIVEKETGKPDERTRVAAVFVNRLKSKMRLQSDPTIIYGLIGGKGSLGRPILKSEIEQPTPYNTYVIDGLPPGPIANPGRASLEAAANPARTKELYFVADGTGGHVFSETYDQHQKNVARLRVHRAQATAAARADRRPPMAATGARRQALSRSRL